MRDTILRIIDDLDTKAKDARESTRTADYVGYYLGLEIGLVYALRELKKVVDDHGKS